jgi:flagellar basal-body rod modification protein FlgD
LLASRCAAGSVRRDGIQAESSMVTTSSALGASTTPQTVATGSGSTTNTSLASFSSNFNNFLTLLTAQLKNQDPLSPMNATEFTTQLVQFTGVEQMIKQNQNLEALINLQTQGQVTNALGYIGKTVEATGQSVQLSNGTATFPYNVGTGATGAAITIKNAAGQTVYTGPVPHGAGAQSFTWDGRNTGGVQQPDGMYTYQIDARNASNSQVAVTTKLTGVVTSIETVNGNIVLHVGNQTVPLSDVLAVR